ncbi:MAG: epimerase [Rhodobacteraceae bacterium]|nr:MAG: epimerase [Paracoccaceae bacterium]
MERVLITGAAGRIGRLIRSGLRAPDRMLRLVDIADLGTAGDREEIYVIDATNLSAMKEAMLGVDVVIHLAAYPEEAPWETIFPLNYQLSHTMFEAARQSGVKRVVFASSVQAVGFHSLENTISDSARIRPSGFYGVSKAFGEALGSLYADKYGLSVGCLRIASFEEEPSDERMLSTWLSFEDGIHLFECAINAPHHHYYRIFGVSNNTRSRVDNSHVSWLGYRPNSNAENFAGKVLDSGTELGLLAGKTQGGSACEVGFCGDVKAALSAT